MTTGRINQITIFMPSCPPAYTPHVLQEHTCRDTNTQHCMRCVYIAPIKDLHTHGAFLSMVNQKVLMVFSVFHAPFEQVPYNIPQQSSTYIEQANGAGIVSGLLTNCFPRRHHLKRTPISFEVIDVLWVALLRCGVQT